MRACSPNDLSDVAEMCSADTPQILVARQNQKFRRRSGVCCAGEDLEDQRSIRNVEQCRERESSSDFRMISPLPNRMELRQ